MRWVVYNRMYLISVYHQWTVAFWEQSWMFG